MYSLIVSAAPDRWATSPAEFDARRFLEHTAPHLQNVFQLSNATASQLMQMPTVFAYETGSGTEARVGRVKDLKWSNSTMKFGFDFDPAILPIDLRRFYAASDHLGIERSEPSRTHWAIKDVDLFQALEVAGLLVRSSPKAVSAAIGQAIPPSGLSMFAKASPQYVDLSARIPPQIVVPSSIPAPDLGASDSSGRGVTGVSGVLPGQAAPAPSGLPASMTPIASSVGQALHPEHAVAQASFGSKPRVFLVHGRDELLQNRVYAYLLAIGMDVVVLSEQANGGRTIMEKFEKEATGVDFAVVLMTPDDVGGLAEDPSNLKPRARQNVILELGYFIGKLGRKKVCVMRHGLLEDASDFSGVGYVEASGDWKRGLLRELNDANIPYDAQKASLS